MTLLLYRAFARAGYDRFPLPFESLSAYIWLQQAFLALFAVWFWDSDILEMVESGSVAYELCRPTDLYTMWYVKTGAARLSRAVLRCAPILLVAVFLPAPFGLTAPASALQFLAFLLSLALGFGVVLAFGMLVYAAEFFTVSPAGLRVLVVALVDFCQGRAAAAALSPRRAADGAGVVALRRDAERAAARLQRLPRGRRAAADAGGCSCSGCWRWCCSAGSFLARGLRRAVVQGG
jgi:ABC-2 type transport system permease protein